MAIAIAEAAATGADLRQETGSRLPRSAVARVVQRERRWRADPPVLSQAADGSGSAAQTAREQSAALHERTGRTAGNGSLMRTAPVALAYLDDEASPRRGGPVVSELTHYDSEAGGTAWQPVPHVEIS